MFISVRSECSIKSFNTNFNTHLDKFILGSIIVDEQIGVNSSVVYSLLQTRLNMGTSADMLHCSLCLDEFKDPRALPCLHKFCLDCLVQLCASSQHHGKLKCPMCQEQHQIPLSGADGFRKDFRIKSFMEMNNAKAKGDCTSRYVQMPPDV